MIIPPFPRLLTVLTNEGATADTAYHNQCDQDTYIVRPDVGDEASCDEESSAHPHDDGNDGHCEAEHGDVHNRGCFVADGLVWIAKGG
jgi:hypothetical protein